MVPAPSWQGWYATEASFPLLPRECWVKRGVREHAMLPIRREANLPRDWYLYLREEGALGLQEAAVTRS